jgi:hypothetical protein
LKHVGTADWDKDWGAKESCDTNNQRIAMKLTMTG